MTVEEKVRALLKELNVSTAAGRRGEKETNPLGEKEEEKRWGVGETEERNKERLLFVLVGQVDSRPNSPISHHDKFTTPVLFSPAPRFS